MCLYHLIKYVWIKDCCPTTHTHTHTYTFNLLSFDCLVTLSKRANCTHFFYIHSLSLSFSLSPPVPIIHPTGQVSKTVPSVHVIYWPSTEPSVKRFTYVNKRNNSWSRWSLDNNITRCLDGLSRMDTRGRSENQHQTEGFGPSVTHGWATPTKMRMECCLV